MGREIQMPAKKNSADIASNFVNEHLRIFRKLHRKSDDRALEKREAKNEDIQEKSQEIRELVPIGMNRIRELIDIEIRDPDALLDPGLKKNNYLGLFSFVSKKVYLSDTLSAGRKEQVVNHELTHYVRHSLKPRRFLSFRYRRNLAKYHLIKATEEGTAEFLGSYLSRNISGTADIMDQLSRIRDTHGIKEFYGAIVDEAKNPDKKMKKLDEYLKKHRTKHGWSVILSKDGLKGKRSSVYTENYNIGVMLSMILLATNEFDEKATALEMLTRSNEDLIKHIFAGAASNSEQIDQRIEELDAINKSYSEKIRTGKRTAELLRARDFRLFEQKRAA